MNLNTLCGLFLLVLVSGCVAESGNRTAPQFVAPQPGQVEAGSAPAPQAMADQVFYLGDWVRGDYFDARLASYSNHTFRETVRPKGSPAYNHTVTVHNATFEVVAHNGTRRLELGKWPPSFPQGEQYVWNWSNRVSDRESSSAARGQIVGPVVLPGRIELRFYTTFLVEGVQHQENGSYTWLLT